MEEGSGCDAVQTSLQRFGWKETRLLSASPYSLPPELLKRHILPPPPHPQPCFLFFFLSLSCAKKNKNEKHRRGRGARVLDGSFPSSSPKKSSVGKAQAMLALPAGPSSTSPRMVGTEQVAGHASSQLAPASGLLSTRAMGPAERHLLLLSYSLSSPLSAS